MNEQLISLMADLLADLERRRQNRRRKVPHSWDRSLGYYEQLDQLKGLLDLHFGGHELRPEYWERAMRERLLERYSKTE